MKEQAEQQDVNKLYESYFSVVGSAHITNINDILDSDDSTDETDLRAMDDWFENYQKEREASAKKEKRLKFLHSGRKKVAMILLLVLSSTFALSMTVEAFRVKLYDVFIEDRDIFTFIRVTAPEDEAYMEYEVNPENKITYMPNGFVLKEAFGEGDFKLIVFTNGDKLITIQTCELGTSILLDTEDAVVKDVYIRGYKGFTSEKEVAKIVFWTQENLCYCLTSDIELNELVKIAESFTAE